MLKSVSFFPRYFLFWIVFFFINRALFEFWNIDNLKEISLDQILLTFIYGLHMDASMAAYISIIPFIIFIITWLIPSIPLGEKLILYYTFFLIFLTTLITGIDLNIYVEWGSKINYRAIEFFLQSPSEAMASSASSPLYITFFIIVMLSFFGFFLSNKFIFNQHPDIKASTFLIKLPIALLFLGLTFLAIRGGWGVAPMNPSKVYFSSIPVLNHAALNTNWLLMSDIVKNRKRENPYQYISKEEAETIVENLYPKNQNSTTSILNVKKPNIVFIILESFTADIIKELGGEADITPHFSELIKDGLLFTDFYSSADRTDKGIISILSAFPSQAIKSIIKENNKQEKLPSLIQELSDAAYYTSFFYGGNTEFSNFKSYLLSHNIQYLYDQKSFDSKEITSNWGAFDEVTFDKQLNYLNTAKQPFFSTLLTLTNHEPFQLPGKHEFENNSVQNKFRSTSYYTAQALFNFIEKAKKTDWYNNTLFVIVADHGHRLPKEQNEIYQTNRYHIPLLFLGGALKNNLKGKTNEKTGGQTDIAATLLSQLDLKDSVFKYSNNLFAKEESPAFYCWDNGFGIKRNGIAVSYDPISKNIIYFKPENISAAEKEKSVLYAKALMQSVYQDYLDY